MKRTKLPEIAGITADQWGMVSAAQAATVGVSAQTLARLAGTSELERLSHGIYRLAGSPPGPHDDLRAAWIALDTRRTAAIRIATGPTEVVSHRSAAAVHDLGDLVADRMEFTTSVRRQTRRADVRIHRDKLDAEDWVLVDGLPVTTPLRTIDDLAAERIDRGHLAGVVRDALVQQVASTNHVVAVLAPHARAYGLPANGGNQLLDIMLNEAGVPQSLLEIAERAGPEAQQAPLSQRIQAHIDETIQSAIDKLLANLAASLEHTDDPDAAIRQLLAGLAQGRRTPKRHQVETPTEPNEANIPEAAEPDDER